MYPYMFIHFHFINLQNFRSAKISKKNYDISFLNVKYISKMWILHKSPYSNPTPTPTSTLHQPYSNPTPTLHKPYTIPTPTLLPSYYNHVQIQPNQSQLSIQCYINHSPAHSLSLPYRVPPIPTLQNTHPYPYPT